MNAPALVQPALLTPGKSNSNSATHSLVEAGSGALAKVISSDRQAPVENTSQQHWRMSEAQIGQAGIIAQQAPLVFNFSEPDVVGAGPWLNKLRIINFSRFAATASTGFSGFKEKSPLRLWGAIVGTYSNFINIIFGSKKGPIAGALQMAAGEWSDEGEWKSQTVKGKVPADIVSEIEKLLNESEVPPKSVLIDSKPDSVIIRVKSQYFSEIQTFLHEKLSARQEAMKALYDAGRMVLGSGDGLVGAIKLEGLADQTKKELENILEKEWRVPVYISKEKDQGTYLHIGPEHQVRFAEKQQNELDNKPTSITVRRKYESPSGIFESILRPDKYPFQNGLIVGGILANALRIYAGLKGDELSQYQPIKKEIEGSVISMLAYFIEAQREIQVEKDLYAPTSRTTDEGTINNLANKTFQILNERPLLAAAPMKAWMIWNRAQDAWSKKLDKNTGEMRRDNWKVIGTSFDALSAILTATAKKSDYGG